MKRWQIILIIIFGILLSARMLTKDNFQAVIPGEIYRSAQLSASKLEAVVADYGIQTVISLRRPKPGKDWYKNEKAMAESLGIAHHDIAMDLTFSPRIDHLLELRDLIENAPKPLLVHCKGGANRTGLASIMAKLLDGSSSLADARAQVSWKFLVTRDNSVGIPFFDGYSAWLNASDQEHSTDKFNEWLENEYIDLSGNIHFLVDPIEEQIWERPWGLIEDGHEFQVRRLQTDTLDLSGWAFDTHDISLLDSVEVYLNDVRFEFSGYGIYQPWLF
ncbi:MAG: tyrosine-protein phosphatase, partial [Proteobacteria bacterium]|nr:tyrosine-protein phosphatase [Pseudomonadota bacterium]